MTTPRWSQLQDGKQRLVLFLWFWKPPVPESGSPWNCYRWSRLDLSVQQLTRICLECRPIRDDSATHTRWRSKQWQRWNSLQKLSAHLHFKLLPQAHVGCEDNKLPTDFWPEESLARMEEKEGQKGRGWFSNLCYLRILAGFSSSFTSKETKHELKEAQSHPFSHTARLYQSHTWPVTSALPTQLPTASQMGRRVVSELARATHCSEQLQGPCWHCSRIWEDTRCQRKSNCMTLASIHCSHLTGGHVVRSVKCHHMCEIMPHGIILRFKWGKAWGVTSRVLRTYRRSTSWCLP